MENEDFHLGNNGSGEEDAVETTEEVAVALKKLGDLKRPDGQLVSLTKQDITLLRALIHAPDDADKLGRIIQICDFLDEEEANREIDAFYEAVRLGMDTDFNVTHALSRASINRKGAHQSSRVALLSDTLSHAKFTSNQPRGRNDRNIGSRSPIA